MAVAQNPIHHEIQRILPELCRQITINNEALQSQLADSINSCMTKLSSKMDDGVVKVKSAVTNLQGALSKSFSTVAKALQNENTNLLPVVDGIHPCDSSTSTKISLPDDTNVITMVQNKMPSFENVMSCSTDTVPEVLLEWEIGLNRKPSVMSV
jgi:hypothetical protein